MKITPIAILTASLVLSLSNLAHAADPTVTLSTSDTGSESSFVNGTNWGASSDGTLVAGTAPTAGYAYIDNDLALRTPATTVSSITFVGDSLELEGFVPATSLSNGALIIKSTATSNTITVNDLILNGGSIDQASETGSSNGTTTFTDGIYLTSLGGYLDSNSISSSNGNQTIIVSGPIADLGTATGAGVLNVANIASGSAAGRLMVVELTGTNTYTGATNIYNGGVIQIGNGGTTGNIDDTSAINLNNTALVTGTGTMAPSLAFDRSDSGLTISQAITGTGNVSQIGSGTTTLSGTNTYSGGTTSTSVKGGTLLVTGSLTGVTNAVAVGGFTSANGGLATATLGGNGTIAGNVTTSSANGNVGAIAPGAAGIGSVGTLTLGGVGATETLGAGTVLDFDLASTTTAGAGVNDLLALNDSGLTLGGTTSSPIAFDFNALGTLATTGEYTLIDGATSITGFSASDFTATGIGSDTATFSEDAGDTTIYVSFTSAPEPSTWALMLGGLLLLGAIQRHRRI
jgi:autotransporter-associated beta strand protein